MNNKNMHVIITDLAFGDSSKGATVDYLCRKYGINLVVRYGGAGNCAHNVVESSGRHHEFSQFGSGTLLPNVKTLLSEYVLIEPLALQNEEKRLSEIGVSNGYDRLFVDERCKIITPFDIIVSAIREEQRGSNPHGSAQSGIGERMARSLNPYTDILYAYDLELPAKDIKKKLEDIQNYFVACGFPQDRLKLDLDYTVRRYQKFFNSVNMLKNDEASDMLKKEKAIFEGHQGVLLDEDFGFHPHTTWSHTTKRNAIKLLHNAGILEKPFVVGLTRAYSHRHGAGPFPTHDSSFFVEEPHNSDYSGQGVFRRGYLDIPLLNYAITANRGIDALAISHLDVLKDALSWKVCTSYTEDVFNTLPKSLSEQEALTYKLFKATPVYEEIDSKNLCTFLEKILESQICLTAWGATAEDRQLNTSRFNL